MNRSLKEVATVMEVSLMTGFLLLPFLQDDINNKKSTQQKRKYLLMY